MLNYSVNLVVDRQQNGSDGNGLSDLKRKIYDEKSMCVFLKYLTDKKWAEYKDEKDENKVHANHDVITKNIKTLRTMSPDNFIDKDGEFYNLSKPYKVIILSRIFEFQNDENQKFNIGKSLEKNITEMNEQYKKYPVGVFENILRLRFENIIESLNKNENNNYNQNFSNRESLASAIRNYLTKNNLRPETKCLLWEYYGYFSAQENTINEMKRKADFVDAINVIRGQRIENQIENQIEEQIIDGDKNYKSISDAKEKDAFLSGVLKACGNHKWNFDNTRLSSLSNSEQKIIISHLQGFDCPQDAYGINRVKKQITTPNEVANFVLGSQTKEYDKSYYTKLFQTVLFSLISAICFVFKNEIYELNDAHAKIIGVNMFQGLFNGIGVTNWLESICKDNGCNLGNIPDFVVAELVYAACNDESYDFSSDINFSGSKPDNEKDRDLEIENLLNFLADKEKQKTITNFNSEQKKLHGPTSNKALRHLKIRIGVAAILSLGLVALSLWLVSLISVTFCFVELGIFVFHQIINFIANNLSEDNRIAKIIQHKYTQYLLDFLQLPIILVNAISIIGISILLGCIGCIGCCAIYCVANCCPSVFGSYGDNRSEDENIPLPSTENYQDLNNQRN